MHHNTTTAYHPQSNGMVEQLASAPALGPSGHQQRPQGGQQQVSSRDGLQHLPYPSCAAGGQQRAAGGQDPAGPRHQFF